MDAVIVLNVVYALFSENDCVCVVVAGCILRHLFRIELSCFFFCFTMLVAMHDCIQYLRALDEKSGGHSLAHQIVLVWHHVNKILFIFISITLDLIPSNKIIVLLRKLPSNDDHILYYIRVHTDENTIKTIQ